MAEQLFNRRGVPLTPHKGFAVPTHESSQPCSRCGGAGKAEKWRHTGLTCYRCGGNGKDPSPLREKLYTAEQNAKLDAIAEKKAAKKAAQRAEAARLEAERVEREQAEIISIWQLFVERLDGELAHGENEFLTSVRDRIMLQAKEPSEAQIAKVNEVIDRNEAERERLAAAKHVGEVGQRVDLELTLLYIRSSELPFHPYVTTWWSLFVDANGCKVASKSEPRILGLRRVVPEGGTEADRSYQKGSKVRVKATIKEHTTSSKGEPLTYISRPKVL